MYLFYYLVICAGFLNFLAFTTIATSQNTSKFQKLVCTVYDHVIITNYSCSTKPISRQKTTVTISALSSVPVAHFMIHAQIFRKFNVVYKPFLVDVTENFCDGLAKKSNAPYVKIFFDLIGPNTNLNHTCPIEGWMLINNVSLDFTKLKLVIPRGEYRVDITGTLNKTPLKSFMIQAYLEISEKD